MKSKKILVLLGNICLTLVLVGVFVMAACAPKEVAPSVKPIELSYSNFFPATYPQSKMVEDWIAEIEKRTEGRVKITYYPGGSLTGPTECFDGVIAGTSDIGMSAFAYSPGRFPEMEVVDLPGYPTMDARITSLVAWGIYEKFKPSSLEGVKVLYVMAHEPGVIQTRDKPVRTLEDLKGLKIRCTGLSVKIVEALGATPVALPLTQAYDPLSKGIVDGTFSGYDCLKSYRFAEVTKYTIECQTVGYVTAMYAVMNLDKWNSLPKDIQKVFDEVSSDWVVRTGERWNLMAEDGYKFGKEAGHTFISLSPEESARWAAVVNKPLEDAYIASMEAKGLPGKEIVDYKHQLVAKYLKIYPAGVEVK